jgi:serine phosphatase RsbU (regulator of sigma subunit)
VIKPQATSPARSPGASGARPLIEAVAAAVVIYLIAGLIETGLIAVIRPTAMELTWISDMVVAAGFGVAVYLWRHLQATRSELKEFERQSVVLQTQLALAADLQRRLLPEMPAATTHTSWAASLTPAGHIGGDFYDVLEVSPTKWMVLVADVSGKGIAAAMALALVRSTFRSLAREGLAPSAVITRLSDALYQEWHGEPYLTCVVSAVDDAARTIVCANAGHPPALIIRADTETQMTNGGPPAGLLPGCEYQDDRHQLQRGDVCVLVTDGITESLDDNVTTALRRVAGAVRGSDGTVADICRQVMTLAASGPGPSNIDEWDDDRTVFAIAVH